MQDRPPGYQLPPPTPRKSANRALWIIAACIAVPCCGLLGLGAYLVTRTIGEIRPFMGCMGTFQTVYGALAKYAKDHKGKLPPAAKWQDEIKPYISKVRTANDPFETPADLASTMVWGCESPDGKAKTGVAFNAELGGKTVDKIGEPRETPLIFETEAGAPNLNQAYKVERVGKPPTFIFGQERGWIEVMAEGSINMLMNKRGRFVRVQLPNAESMGKDFNDLPGTEVKQQAGQPKR